MIVSVNGVQGHWHKMLAEFEKDSVSIVVERPKVLKQERSADPRWIVDIAKSAGELLGFCDLEPLGAQRRHALGAGAARLRGLLRLSLMDDNDLQLAQRALREAAAFFEALRAAAAHAGRTPHALWASLQQPVNARG